MKVARTYRLDPEVAERIVILQKVYSSKLNVDLSQADVIKMLVNTEYKSLNREIIREVKE